MWLFYVTKDGYNPCGSDGAMQLTAPRSPRYIRKQAQLFLQHREGSVYGLSEWTQRMCELGAAAFCKYITDHGVLLASDNGEI